MKCSGRSGTIAYILFLSTISASNYLKKSKKNWRNRFLGRFVVEKLPSDPERLPQITCLLSQSPSGPFSVSDRITDRMRKGYSNFLFFSAFSTIVTMTHYTRTANPFAGYLFTFRLHKKYQMSIMNMQKV